jgi:hypothetical protein
MIRYSRACGSYQEFLDRGLLLTRKLLNKGFLLVKLKSLLRNCLRSPPWPGWPLWNICATNDHGYVPLVVNTSRYFPHSRLITGFVTILTRWVPLVEQELLTLPEHLSSPPVFSGARVTRSLVLYVCFIDRCLSFCTFSFGHCVVCSSSIYGFWLPLWYLQTLLNKRFYVCNCFVFKWSAIYREKKKLFMTYHTVMLLIMGPSWSYGSSIYDYLCYQCISPLKLGVGIPLMARCTRYHFMLHAITLTHINRIFLL